LDVAPQTQIEADRVFEKEAGFQDALTGVYLKISQESLYGRELTFGMVDGLAGQFNGQASANQYFSTITYDYDELNFIEKSKAAFGGAYNAIANLNLLIQNIDEKGPSMFTGVNYNIIRGEAYALRAFLHFDMLRLFAPSVLSQSSASPSIPYVDAIGTLAKERLTTSVFLEKVLQDLSVAEQALAGSDPMVPENAANASTYLRDRQYKFNYYAVKALQARVLLYAGRKQDALQAANAVINSNVFEWTPSSQIANPTDPNKIFTQELIFRLRISNLATITAPFYDIGVSGSLLSKSPFEYQQLFDRSDYRFVYQTVLVSSLDRQYSTKLVQSASSSAAYGNQMPIIRKSELFYIAAECLMETDIARSISYLNEVRRRRNLQDLSVALTLTQLQSELKMEYRREFIGEGQLFYYYKRLNAPSIDDVFVNMSDATYVLPLPDNEVSYGQ